MTREQAAPEPKTAPAADPLTAAQDEVKRLTHLYRRAGELADKKEEARLKPLLKQAREAVEALKPATRTETPAPVDTSAGRVQETAESEQVAKAPAPQPEVDAAPNRVKVMTRFGQNVYVNKADLDSNKERLRYFTSTGKSLGVIVRENLDPTGEKRAAYAAETADNPLFDVIGTKDGKVFASEAAAARQRSMDGFVDTHDIVPMRGGFALKRKPKQEAEAPTDAAAPAPQAPPQGRAPEAAAPVAEPVVEVPLPAEAAPADTLRTELQQVEQQILAAAPGRFAKGGGDIEAAAKRKEVPAALKERRKALKAQIRAADAAPKPEPAPAPAPEPAPLPAAEPAPAPEPPARTPEQARTIELKKRLKVLEALRRCVG